MEERQHTLQACSTRDDRYDEAVVEKTSTFVRDHLEGEPTGHDWWHAVRVRNMARLIAHVEGADIYVVELAALLHDIADYKFTGNEDLGAETAGGWLETLNVDRDVVTAVKLIVRQISFIGARVPESVLSLEGLCVQDADRLDAMGAIGIARTFAYGGYVRRPIHDPDVTPVLHDSSESYRGTMGTTINHFSEKLLLLKDRMRTSAGRALAIRRHRYMVDYLREFHMDWDLWVGAGCNTPAGGRRACECSVTRM